MMTKVGLGLVALAFGGVVAIRLSATGAAQNRVDEFNRRKKRHEGQNSLAAIYDLGQTMMSQVNPLDQRGRLERVLGAAANKAYPSATTAKPSMPAKSLSRVTSVAPKASAVAAIQRSFSSSGRPLCRRASLTEA